MFSLMQKISLFLICLFSLFTSYTQASKDRKILPIILHHGGIGTMYGVGYSDIYKKQYKYLLGGVLGDVEAVGTNVTYQPNDEKTYNFSFGYVQKINSLTYFERGTKINDNTQGYGQKAKLSALGANAELKLVDWNWKFSGAFVDSKIEGFTDDSKKEAIETPTIHLTPFRQLTLGVNAGKEQYFSQHKLSGVKYSFDLTNRTPSAGYSGDSVFTLENRWFFKVFRKSQLSLRGFYSTVLAVAEKKIDARDAFSIECNQVSKASKRAECEKFENDISSYITEHNKKGTARALGGAKYLPAYAEGRFRASNSAFAGIDFTHHLADKKWVPNLYLSQAIGFANDDSSKLTDNSQTSLSGGFKWDLDELSLVAQYATGNDGSLFSFTVQR
jgi:hypothetical protein